MKLITLTVLSVLTMGQASAKDDVTSILDGLMFDQIKNVTQKVMQAVEQDVDFQRLMQEKPSFSEASEGLAHTQVKAESDSARK